MKCYLFDIDGTIADLSHRLHHIVDEFDSHGTVKPKDWKSFFAACKDDKPILHVIELLLILHDTDQQIIFVSGRSDECRTDTVAWMRKHDLPDRPLYMRRAGDHRPDYLVKGELLDQILADGYEPVMAFDDRDQVVKMWRERGVPCAQVADGAF